MRNGLGLIDLSVTEDETGMKGGVALKRESADILIAVDLIGPRWQDLYCDYGVVLVKRSDGRRQEL